MTRDKRPERDLSGSHKRASQPRPPGVPLGEGGELRSGTVFEVLGGPQRGEAAGHRGGTPARPAEDTACASGVGKVGCSPEPGLWYGTIGREMASDTGAENLR